MTAFYGLDMFMVLEVVSILTKQVSCEKASRNVLQLSYDLILNRVCKLL